METRSIRRTIARLSARRRLLRDLRRRAEWVDQARNTPTLRCWLETRESQRAGDPHQRSDPRRG